MASYARISLVKTAALFGLGEDDRHISTVDEEGVAFAAIKALRAEVADRDRQITSMRREEDTKFARLETRLAAVEEIARAAANSADPK